MNRFFGFFCAAIMLVGCQSPTSTAYRRHCLQRGPLLYQAAWHGEFVARHTTTIYAPDVESNYLTVRSLREDGTQVREGEVVLSFESNIAAQELDLARAQAEIERAVLARTKEELALNEISFKSEHRKKFIELQQAEVKLRMSGSLLSGMEKERLNLEIKKLSNELSSCNQAQRTFNLQRQATLRIAELKVAEVTAQVQKKEKHLAAMEVLAPVAGIVFGPYTRLNFQFGKVAAGSVVRPGDKILEIPDLSSFDLLLFLRQKDASYLHLDDRVRVYPTIAPELDLEAQVVEKSKFALTQNERLSLDRPQGNFKEIAVKLRIDKSLADIRPGSTARVEAQLLQKKDCLLMPLIYVQEEGASSFVRRDDGRKMPIKLGASTSSYTEVLDGLREGDCVIF